MYSVSCENLGREHYFSLVHFSSVESSVNCMTSCFLPPILLCPSAVISPPSTASQEAVPVWDAQSSRWTLCLTCTQKGAGKGGILLTLIAQRTDQPAVVPPTKALPWGSQDKINQRALKEMGNLRQHSLQQVPGEGGSLFSPALKEFFAFFFDYS